MTIHGFIIMMLKQKPSLHNRSQKCHPEPKKQGKFSQMWRWCWRFLCFEGAAHHEFLPHGQTVNKEHYLKRSNICERQGEEKGPFSEGRKNGCSTTMLPHIPHCLFVTTLQSMRPQLSHYHCNRQISHQQTSFCSWSWNSYWKSDFWHCSKHPRKLASETVCYSTKCIPAMLPKLEKILGAVY